MTLVFNDEDKILLQNFYREKFIIGDTITSVSFNKFFTKFVIEQIKEKAFWNPKEENENDK